MKLKVYRQDLVKLSTVVFISTFLTACGNAANPKYRDTSELEQPPQVVTFKSGEESETQTGSEKDAKKGLGDSVHTPDESTLIVDKPFDVAWPVVAVALDMSGMEISDRNREKGQYYVEFDPDHTDLKNNESKSLFSTIFLTSDKYPKGRYLLTFYENPRSVKIEAKFLEYVENDVSSQDGYAESSATDKGVEKLLKKLYITLHDDFPLN